MTFKLCLAAEVKCADLIAAYNAMWRGVAPIHPSLRPTHFPFPGAFAAPVPTQSPHATRQWLTYAPSWLIYHAPHTPLPPPPNTHRIDLEVVLSCGSEVCRPYRSMSGEIPPPPPPGPQQYIHNNQPPAPPPAELTFKLCLAAEVKCADLIAAYNACVENRTVTAAWACKKFYKTSSACISE